jgi:predicted HTH transcriptional regulator
MSKSLRERAESTARELQDILGITDESHSSEVADAVEQAIIKALIDERNRCAKVAKEYFSDDTESGTRVSDEISRVRSVLITNLSAMR